MTKPLHHFIVIIYLDDLVSVDICNDKIFLRMKILRIQGIALGCFLVIFIVL